MQAQIQNLNAHVSQYAEAATLLEQMNMAQLLFQLFGAKVKIVHGGVCPN